MAKKAAEDKQATPEVVEVKLGVDHTGTHTVYLNGLRIDFIDGTAEVPAGVADELRKLGIVS